jgi:uncharacterized UBP type Zn finger protein
VQVFRHCCGMTGNASNASLESTLSTTCSHLSEARILQTDKTYCEECVKTGQHWVHLRLCLTCGHVGCCDSSPNRHASGHYHETGHPLVRSIERGERWVWCYADKVLVGDVPAA